MNTSRQRCQHDSCNCRPTDFLPYRRESEEKANKKRGAPAPTPLSTPSKETDNNPRYFQCLSQAQKNLFPNYSSITKATLLMIWKRSVRTWLYSFLSRGIVQSFWEDGIDSRSDNFWKVCCVSEENKRLVRIKKLLDLTRTNTLGMIGNLSETHKLPEVQYEDLGPDLSHKTNQNITSELTRIHESDKLSKENMRTSVNE